MTGLAGLAWNHPRATGPLIAGGADWTRRHHGLPVHWDTRSLKEFEDQDLAELTRRYDLILIDHPIIGTAAEDRLLLPVDDWVSPDYLADQRENAVGPSFESYEWSERPWALPVDAACQVSASRPELLHAVGAERPLTWSAVSALAEELHGRPHQVAVPLVPNHAYCTFLSVGQAIAADEFWRFPEAWDDDVAAVALRMLQTLGQWLHPLSRSSDPIALSDHMCATSEIAYVPLMFGYSCYARAGFAPARLVFGDAPTGQSGHRGSVLGGVGLGVSARSHEPERAASLARHLCSASFQQGGCVEHGGQPAHASAWNSAHANAVTEDFFTATRRTMEGAFVRPRTVGHRLFQPAAGRGHHRGLVEALGPASRTGVTSGVGAYAPGDDALMTADGAEVDVKGEPAVRRNTVRGSGHDRP